MWPAVLSSGRVTCPLHSYLNYLTLKALHFSIVQLLRTTQNKKRKSNIHDRIVAICELLPQTVKLDPSEQVYLEMNIWYIKMK